MSNLALCGTGGHLQLQVECNQEIATGRGGDFPKRKMSGHYLEGNVGLKVDFVLRWEIAFTCLKGKSQLKEIGL